jgi:hypothetical protein
LTPVTGYLRPQRGKIMHPAANSAKSHTGTSQFAPLSLMLNQMGLENRIRPRYASPSSGQLGDLWSSLVFC